MPAGLKPVHRTLADGTRRTYWYHRATGKRLVEDPTTAAGFLEIARLDEVAKAQEKAASALKGTFGSLWQEYRGSQRWRDLRPRTRSDYQAVRDWLASAADVPLIRINLPMVNRLRDKAAEKHGRRFGNYVTQVMRLVMEWGVGQGLIKTNPLMRAKLNPRPKGMARVNRAWLDYEVEAYIAGCPRHLLVPFLLGRLAGMRQGDALRVTWSAYDGRQLRWTASKNGVPCIAPVTGLFKVVLDDAKARRGMAVQIAVNAAGAPWSESGFRASFFKRMRLLRASGAVQDGCTFHGLRHTIVTHARNDGASDFVAAAAIGDSTTHMAGTYGKDADRVAAQIGVLEAEQKRFGNIEWKSPPENARKTLPKQRRAKA